MLKILIPHIDEALAELNYFQTLNGLAEKIKTGDKENNEIEIPALFIGNENFDNIDLEKAMGYHRLYESVKIVELPIEDTAGCIKAFEITYPMIFVGLIDHSANCQTYESDSVANAVAYKLYQTKFDKTIRSQIAAYSIELMIKEINTNKELVWENEYSKVVNSMTFDKIYFSIKYELKIKGSTKCLNIINCC